MAFDNTQAPQTLIYTQHWGTVKAFETGSFLWFVDTLMTPLQLRTQLDNILNMSVLGNMAGDTSRIEGGGAAGTPPTITSRQGYIIFSCDDEVSDGSITLCSGYSGQTMIIMTRGGAEDVSLVLQCGGHTSGLGSGAWVMGDSDEVSLSYITILGSLSMNGYIKLVNFDGETWSVVDYSSKIADGSGAKAAGIVLAPG